MAIQITNIDSYFQEEDLDCQQGVIDFSLYLRSKREVSSDSLSVGGGDRPAELCLETGAAPTSASMSTVLDQKNYIEELNRHLK